MARTALKETSKASYQDILNAPEHMVAEIIGGELVTHPRPSPRHAQVETSLADELVSPFHKGKGGPGGWWILVEPEIHFGKDDILVPDLAGWRREKLPKLPEAAFFDLAPDWVCEIISPRTAHDDRTRKRDIYATNKISWLWMIDPDARVLEAFELSGDGQWQLLAAHANNDQIAIPPFAEAPFQLGALWAD